MAGRTHVDDSVIERRLRPIYGKTRPLILKPSTSRDQRDIKPYIHVLKHPPLCLNSGGKS